MKSINEEIKLFLLTSNYTERTKESYLYYLKIFINWLSKVTNTDKENLYLHKIYEEYDLAGNFIRFKAIDAKLIDQYFLQNLEKSSSWFKGSRYSISSFFKYLERNRDFPNIIDEMNFKFNDYITPSKPQRILSSHEILKLFHAIVSYSENIQRDLLLFIIFLTTGVRISELSSIRIKDIDLTEETISLYNTKGKKDRIVPLKDGISNAIKKYVKLNSLKSNDFLFKINRKDNSTLLKFFLQKANLPDIKPQSLRHSFATMMYSGGSNILAIQQLLDHNDPKTTELYLRFNIEANKDIQIKENQEIYRLLNKYTKSFSLK